MKTKDAINFFGNKNKITKLLNLSSGYVYQWGDVVPAEQAIKLYNLSDKQIPLNEEDYFNNSKKSY